ncbi:MAG: transcription initiation factor IIB [Candidatus Nitrosotenuis sp.]
MSCSPITDFDNGEIICSDCGLVITERLEAYDKEWRSFDGNFERSRVGQATLPALGNMRLFTNIGNENWDFSGSPLSFVARGTMYRLRMYDSRSKNHTTINKNFYKMYCEFEKLKHKLAISDSTIEKATYLFRKAMNRKLTRGRNVLLIAASCLYAACRESNTPRTLSDIAETMNVKKTDVSACLRLIVNELGLTLPTVNLSQCVIRIANSLKVSEKVKRHAIEILQKAERINITAGKEPMGLAAAAIYLAGIHMNEHYSQKALTEIAKTTSVTIRNRSSELRQKILIS